MPKLPLLLAWSLAVINGACAKATTLHPVTIVVAPEGTITKTQPPFIGTGDSLEVRVFDRAYSNRYVARDTLLSLTAVDVSAMAGDTTLKMISLSFAPSTMLTGSGSATKAAASGLPWLTERVNTMTELGLAAIDDSRTREERRYDSLRVVITAHDVMLSATTDTMRAKLDTLRTRVRADRNEHARLTLLVDTTWQAGAQRLETDTAVRAAKQVLNSLATGTLTHVQRSPTYLHTLRGQLEEYGRRLDAFRVLLPAEPPTALSDTSSVPNLMMSAASLSERYDQVFALRAAAQQEALRLAAQINNPQPIPPAPLRPNMLVVGINLSPLLVTPQRLLETTDNARLRLDGVNRGTVRVVTAANQLPRWTVQPDTVAVFTDMFPAEKAVRVVVTRRNRFVPWGTTVAAAATETKPAATTTAAGGTTVTTVTTVTPGGTAAAATPAPAGGTPPAATMPLVVLPKTDDTVAVVTIPVLQRYRFRLGVGMIFSTLRSPALQTHEDSVGGVKGVYVQRIGRNEHRFVPVALLSATLYPFEGRFVDGRARRYPFQNASVSLQTGISLQNPTEHLYAGFAVEPMQGIEIGGGLHSGYVKTTAYESGDFVPLSGGAATASQWKTAWAGTVTLDATTFVRAFGTLLGL
jgi:hypothetical protein